MYVITLASSPLEPKGCMLLYDCMYTRKFPRVRCCESLWLDYVDEEEDTAQPFISPFLVLLTQRTGWILEGTKASDTRRSVKVKWVRRRTQQNLSLSLFLLVSPFP